MLQYCGGDVWPRPPHGRVLFCGKQPLPRCPVYSIVKATYGQAYLVGQHAEASANSKIYIFRIGGEGEHTNRLQNLQSDATQRNPTQWPAAIRPRAIVPACVALRRRANILQSICVFTLSAKPKNEYFAICTRTRNRQATTLPRLQYCQSYLWMRFVMW